MQHGDEAALLVEPGHQAHRGAGRGEADEISHRISARAPFLARIFADHGVVDGDLAECAHHDADGNQDQRQIVQRRGKIEERRQHERQRQRHRLQRMPVQELADGILRHRAEHIDARRDQPQRGRAPGQIGEPLGE
jgi:hypothetical protein